MVKRQKEKQYQSASEHKQYAKLRSGSGMIGGTVQRRLPFHCCALTLTAFNNPVCTSQGIVFDNASLMNFLLKHNMQDPVTGKKLSTTRDIITLHMDQDEEGRWQCPVLTKVFSDHTKVVAILDRSTNEAYVYSYEAYKELNLKTKNWTDLTTGKKFSPKKDVLILNDPQNDEFQKQRDIQTFWHIQNARALDTTTTNNNVKRSVTTTRIMEQLQKDKEKKREESSNNNNKNNNAMEPAAKKLKIFSQDVTGVRFTSGKASGSLTSTAMDVESENTIREASQEEILQARFQLMKSRKEKGYVRLITNLGDLLLELHCDIVPKTCTNFLGLCRAQKYNGTSFHRLIPNFMIQGGKALKSEGEDASLWGPSFADEFDDRLKHTEEGVVSMANAGPGTNKRQFFMTFKSCPHLDRKHSIFGKVVEGMTLLKKMEGFPSDKKDRPLEPITILETDILVDPAKEAEELEHKRMEELAEMRRGDEERKKAKALGKTVAKKIKASSSSSSSNKMVGKYLPKSAVLQQQSNGNGNGNGDDAGIPFPAYSRKIVAPAKTKFGDFSDW